MRIWGATDPGLVRRENQDAYLIRERTASGHAACVVCDGMGGPAGGRLASSVAVRTYLEELEARLEMGMSPDAVASASAAAVSLANRAVRAAAAVNEGCQDMGTTLVAAVGWGGGAVVTNVGDSRAYYITRDGIRGITRDHSVVQDMVERGEITPEEARRHPKRNLITRALGPDEDPRCDNYLCPMGPGARLLLCTDGLTGPVSEQEILFEIIHGAGGGASLRRLVEIARERGAPDNVTAVLMEDG